jgi:hypothetical protein
MYKQIIQIIIVLEQLNHQLDVMDEHRACKELRFTNRRGHNPIHKQLLNKASGDEEELENEENRESENHQPQFQ